MPYILNWVINIHNLNFVGKLISLLTFVNCTDRFIALTKTKHILNLSLCSKSGVILSLTGFDNYLYVRRLLDGHIYYSYSLLSARWRCGYDSSLRNIIWCKLQTYLLNHFIGTNFEKSLLYDNYLFLVYIVRQIISQKCEPIWSKNQWDTAFF